MAEIAVGGVLTGCVGCMLTVEVLTKHNPECMNLLTCSTFIFISFISFFKQSDYLKRLPRSRVPLLRGYMRIVLIFFVVNVSNNLALQYDVSIPLFIISRSGTLLANVLLGYCLRKRICSWGKLLSIILVSIGIILFTLADQFSKHPIIEKDGKSVHPLSILHSSPGIFLLLLAALLSAYLGICQEDLYCIYGNHSQEAIFFIHVLSLPGFFFFYNDIWQAVVHFNNSDTFFIFGFRFPIPSLWIYAILNCIFQWICITNVHTLISLTTSLNVAMIITLRKFLSMVLSIILFKNSFTFMHCVGSLFVLLGTVAFTSCDLNFKSAQKKNV
uniref:Sugar phosphate transporter domain-containing protein n=1 Tax=Onchocerca volvulus TaxID=6282 RepID=A0A8R1TTE6_ONCVO